MKTKKIRIRQGFTIVELVIVIGVVGVLSAVLIPTFINLNSKANRASDESLTKNLNTALAMKEQDPKDTKNVTMQDAVDDLKEYGYLLPNLVTKSEDKLLWNQKTNRFILESDDKGDQKPIEFWRIQDSVKGDEIYSVYAGLNFKGIGDNKDTVNISVGFDVGENEGIKTINYSNTTETVKTAIIRTNAPTTDLTVNAPNDTIKHYGEGKVVNLQAVSTSSYYENGSVAQVNIKKGRLVLTDSKETSVGTVYLQATGDTYDNIIIATQNGAELPDLIARDAVSLPEGTDTKTVVTIQTNVNAEGQEPTKVETISLYSEKDVKEETNGYDVSDLGRLVVEAVSDGGKAEAAEQITDPEELEKVQETKSAVLVSTKQELIDALDAHAKYIKFTEDITLTSYLPILETVTIDGQGHTLNAPIKSGRIVRVGTNDISVTLRNITLDGGGKSERGFQVDSDKRADVELDGVTIGGVTHYAINLCGGSKVNMVISNSHMTGYGVINAYGVGHSIVVSNSTIEGVNPYSGTSNAFCAVCLEGDPTGATQEHAADYNLKFVNSTLSATRTGDQPETILGFNPNAINCKVEFTGCTLTAGEGCYGAYDICGNNSNSIIVNGEALDYPRGVYFNFQ